MTAFYIKQNDTSPLFLATLQDANGTAVDITDASVRFHMVNTRTGAVVVDAAAVVVSGADGEVRYSWDAADTATSGTFKAEWEVTFADSRIETFPNAERGVDVVIVPEIA